MWHDLWCHVKGAWCKGLYKKFVVCLLVMVRICAWWYDMVPSIAWAVYDTKRCVWLQCGMVLGMFKELCKGVHCYVINWGRHTKLHGNMWIVQPLLKNNCLNCTKRYLCHLIWNFYGIFQLWNQVSRISYLFLHIDMVMLLGLVVYIPWRWCMFGCPKIVSK